MENRLIFNKHPSEDILEEYAFNRLSEPDCEELEKHLLVCPRCQDDLAKTDEYIRLMKHAALEWRNQSSVGGSHAKTSRLVRLRSPITAILATVAFTAALAVTIPHFSWHTTGQASPAELVALRGATSPAMARTRAGAPIGIVIDTTDLDDPYGLHIEIVDANGKSVWSGQARDLTPANRISVQIDTRLRTGVYWIRLYSRSGELLREFGLRAD